MNMQRALARPLLAVAPMLVVLGAAAGTAAAKGNDVKVSGTCSSGSHWKLKAGARDSGMETEFEVDSNVAGQVWSVRLTDNGTQVFAGKKTTVAPSGSFSVSRHIADRAGKDTIVATATNAKTGERCSGTVTI